MSLRITADGLEELGQGVRRLGDVDRLLEPVLDAHLEVAREAFNAEATPDGTPWADLAPSSRRGPRAGGILERTGVMRSSLEAIGSGTEGAVGSPLRRAAFNLFGTRRAPARRFLGPIDDATLEGLVRRHVEEATA